MGTLDVGLNAFFNYCMAKNLLGPGNEMWWLK